MRHFALRSCIGCIGLLSVLSLAGCSDDQTGGTTPPATCGGFDPYISITWSSTPKVDILLAIDNSRSMADKQAILAYAVPELVLGLVNPPCYDNNGSVSPNQPAFPTDDCPDPDTYRRFKPITDVHIGVITSSLGGHGADSCPDINNTTPECAPAANRSNNDKGRLIARKGPCVGDPTVGTYQGMGFLAWDPGGELQPPGENVIDDGNGNGLVPSLRDMTLGAGQIGCGYESQLESIYRFLVDPEPYDTITVIDNKATPMGTDDVLLTQRAAFLRPDSLLSIMLLSDENDCSIKEYGQFYYVGQLREGATNVRMPRARQECATNPDGECCKSCGQAPGTCPPDPTCDNGQGGPALLSAGEDDINLRCWDQKRRFGIDFLYPTDRYVQAFTNAVIPNRNGELVDNPLFVDPKGGAPWVRDPGNVFVTGIVGVPWQDLARDPADPKRGFRGSYELWADRGDGSTTWDLILGDPLAHKKPLDPLMLESVERRKGTQPVTGEALVDASDPMQNSINGHEWTIANDDLQYACIFPLPAGMERDCTDPNVNACDCFETTNDNPLCAPNPNNANLPTLQVRAKAYPGRRQLQVLRDIGSQATVGSVCPVQLDQAGPEAADFGYRPAIQGLLDRLTPTADGDGGCLSTPFPLDDQKKVNCVFVEAFHDPNGQCLCDPAKGRIPVAAERTCMKDKMLANPRAEQFDWNCACELAQLDGAAGEACRNDTSNAPQVDGEPINGFCYLDTMLDPPLGNPELAALCPEDAKRIFRFVGKGEPTAYGGIAFVCQGDTSP